MELLEERVLLELIFIDIHLVAEFPGIPLDSIDFESVLLLQVLLDEVLDVLLLEVLDFLNERVVVRNERVDSEGTGQVLFGVEHEFLLLLFVLKIGGQLVEVVLEILPLEFGFFDVSVVWLLLIVHLY